MPLSRALFALALTATVSVVLSLAISAIADDAEPAPDMADVVWDDRPASIAELTAETAALVEAEVSAIEGGPPLGDPDDGGIPTQRIIFQTIETLDGQMSATFKLFKTGSPYLYLQGDPLYEVGERYILFLEPQGEPGTYVPVAPDGRLALDGGKADPVVGGPVAEDLQGLTPAEVAEVAEVAE